MRLALFVVLLVACGKDDAVLPYGDADEASDDDDGAESTNSGDCGDDWILDGDISVQPEVCLVWGPRSPAAMDWFSATTPAEGQAGGCGSACPEDGDGWCPTQEGVGDRSDWHLPTIDEILDASMANPTMDDADGRLWSRSTAEVDDDNAWTVDLSRGGAKMAMGKDQQNNVRCVSDTF